MYIVGVLQRKRDGGDDNDDGGDGADRYGREQFPGKPKSYFFYLLVLIKIV